jgi:hypothetical protein
MRKPTSTTIALPLYVAAYQSEQDNLDAHQLELTDNRQIPNPAVATLYEDALVCLAPHGLLLHAADKTRSTKRVLPSHQPVH